MPSVLIKLNVDDIVRRYESGESEKSIADSFRVDRGVIRRRLISAGVTPRNCSSAMYVRMANTTAEERLRLTQAAHDAVRGKPKRPETLIKSAKTRERTRALERRSDIEGEFAMMLAAREIKFRRNAAVGPYNVDFAVDSHSVAVEIFGGGWHAHGSHADRFLKRTKYLMDRSWSVVVIWADRRRTPLSRGAVDELVAHMNARRANPSTGRQYRMLLGNGEDAPALRSYLNDPATVKRLGGGNR